MKLKDLASRLGLELRGDGELEISSPAPLEAAGAGTITFLAHSKYLPLIENSTASGVITSADLAPKMNRATLISANPYVDFARTLEIFFPSYRPPPGIHPSALIAPDATVGEGASIGAYCVIGAGVRIGRAAVIHPHVTIYPGVRIGDDFTCHSQVSIRDNVTIGNGVVIHNGAVIGADGFGFVEYQENLVKIPQVGGVTIEDQVETRRPRYDRSCHGRRHRDSTRRQARQPGAHRPQLRGWRIFALCRAGGDRGFGRDWQMVRVRGAGRMRRPRSDRRPGQSRRQVRDSRRRGRRSHDRRNSRG